MIIDTIEVRRKTGATTDSEAVLTILKRGDGSFEFAKAGGGIQRPHCNEDFSRLFDALKALA